MADAPDEQDEGLDESKKGGSLKLIIIAVVALVVIGGGAVGAWFFFASGDSDKNAATAKAAKDGAPAAPLVGPIYSMKTFIVNLADPGGRRYLKVKLDLELTNREVDKEIKARIAEVRDQIILALSSKTYQQIQGVAGKTVLREELMARTNAVLKLGKVKKAFFTEFVVQ